jgi:hypothetical protein
MFVLSAFIYKLKKYIVSYILLWKMATKSAKESDATNFPSKGFSTSTIYRENNFSKLYAPFYTFYTKDESIEFMKKQNNNNLKLFCADKSDIDGKIGVKFFIITTYDIMYDISKKYDSHLYENCESDNNVKLHIDIDVKLDNTKNINVNNLFDTYVEKVLEYFTKCIFPKINITTYSYIILKSDDISNKISGHIIFPDIIFTDIYCIKYLLFDNDNNNELLKNKILDPSIYRTGCFRMMYSSKLNKNNKLKYYSSYNYNIINDKTTFMDTLICNTDIKYNLKTSKPKKNILANINKIKNIGWRPKYNFSNILENFKKKI